MTFADNMQTILQEGEHDGSGVVVGGLITRWVVVYEVMDPLDGEKILGLRATTGVTPWDLRGMLSEATSTDWVYAEGDD